MPPEGCKSMTAEWRWRGWNRKLRTYIFNGKHKAQRADWEWCEALKPVKACSR